MKTDPDDLKVLDVLELKSQQMLIVNPKYQRGSVWTPPQKKELVDSFLRGYPSCPHPGDERRQLPLQAKLRQTRYLNHALRPRITQQLHRHPLAYFYSAIVAYFGSALDKKPRNFGNVG
jgi:hypothetical protein